MDKEILLLLAEIMPEQLAVELLERAILEYKESKNLDVFSGACLMILAKLKFSKTGVEETKEEIRNFQEKERQKEEVKSN